MLILTTLIASALTTHWFVKAGEVSTGGVFSYYRAVSVPGLLGLCIIAAFVLLVLNSTPAIWGPILVAMVVGGFTGSVFAEMVDSKIIN